MRGQISLIVLALLGVLGLFAVYAVLHSLGPVLVVLVIGVLAYFMGPKLANPKIFGNLVLLAAILLVGMFAWNMMGFNIEQFSIVNASGHVLHNASMTAGFSMALPQLAAVSPEAPMSPAGFSEDLESYTTGKIILAPRTYRPIDVKISNNDQLPLVVPSGSVLVAVVCDPENPAPVCNLKPGESVPASQLFRELVNAGKQVLNQHHVGVTVVDPSDWDKIVKSARDACGSTPLLSDMCRAGAGAGAKLFAASFARFTKNEDVRNAICQDTLIWDRATCMQLADNTSVCSKAVNPFERDRVFFVYADADAPTNKQYTLKIFLLTPPSGLYGTVASTLQCTPGLRQLSEVVGGMPMAYRVAAVNEIPLEVKYPNTLLTIVAGAIGVVLVGFAIYFGRRLIH